MTYNIVEMKLEELKETLDLVKDDFDGFEAPYYSKEGVQNFYKFIDYNIIQKQLNNNFKIFVIKVKEKITGMVCIRDCTHIAMLFVDKEYHRQGIGTKLANKAIEYCKGSAQKITVNSSPYAIEFYHKLGFKDTDKLRTEDGITFLPMKINI